MTRKFKITSDRSSTITYVQSDKMLAQTVANLARQAHPRKPVTILVQDLTSPQEGSAPKPANDNVETQGDPRDRLCPACGGVGGHMLKCDFTNQ